MLEPDGRDRSAFWMGNGSMDRAAGAERSQGRVHRCTRPTGINEPEPSDEVSDDVRWRTELLKCDYAVAH